MLQRRPPPDVGLRDALKPLPSGESGFCVRGGASDRVRLRSAFRTERRSRAGLAQGECTTRPQTRGSGRQCLFRWEPEPGGCRACVCTGAGRAGTLAIDTNARVDALLDHLLRVERPPPPAAAFAPSSPVTNEVKLAGQRLEKTRTPDQIYSLTGGFMVHLLRNYSNRKHATEQNRTLLADTRQSARPDDGVQSGKKQAQRKLSTPEIRQLVQRYVAGETAYQLAGWYGISRNTVV